MGRIASLSLVLAVCSLGAPVKGEVAGYKTGLDVLGVDATLASRYQPVTSSSGPLFKCISDGKTIPYTSINDDFCDCADGSDEPGTSACSYVRGTKFWCRNEGHESAWIWSSRVGDGICDSECCDGSDENNSNSGVTCPNTCVEAGKAFRQKRDAETKIRKTGAKIRSTYISHAKSECTRLATEIETLTAQLQEKKDEVQVTKTRLDRLESSDKEELERRKTSPLFKSLLDHRSAISSLRKQIKQLKEDEEVLKSILKDLSEGYNPNYQDMAVKAAVVGYTERFVRGEGPKEGETEPVKIDHEGEAFLTEEELNNLDKQDLDGLAMSVDMGSDDEDGEDSVLYRLDQYIPDFLYDHYESVRDLVLTYLIKAGVVGKKAAEAVANVSDAPHTAAARQSHHEAVSALTHAENALQSSKTALEKLSGEFGPEAEWKKLEGTCIEKEQGEYTYSLCFFGQATQKSNRDGARNNLGTYSRWNAGPGVEPTSEAYYSKQLYDRGLKCWNGPERSVKLDLSCGTTNELLQISEPEKCEYHFRATTPALCWPDSTWNQSGKGTKVKVEHHAGHTDL